MSQASKKAVTKKPIPVYSEACYYIKFCQAACDSPLLIVDFFSCSFNQIYNEMIRDLLNPSLGYLDLREDAKGFIQVAGITEVSTINAKEVNWNKSCKGSEKHKFHCCQMHSYKTVILTVNLTFFFKRLPWICHSGQLVWSDCKSTSSPLGLNNWQIWLQ